MTIHLLPKKTLTAFALAGCALLLLTGFRAAEFMSGDKIMAMVEERHASDSEVEVIKVVTTDRSGNTQERKIMSIIARDPAGNYRYLIRFLEPEMIKGVTLLTIEHTGAESDQYLFLPAMGPTGEVRKIQGTQKSQSFMGTDFTFEDLRKERTPDYMYHRQLDTTLNGRDCYQILSAPADRSKLEAAGFTSRMIFVDKTSLNVLRIDFYDENDNLVKTFEGFDYDSVEVDGPTKRPRRAVMNNHEKGTTSMMVLLKSRLNFQLDERIFDPQMLKQWTPEADAALMSVFATPQ